MQLVRTAVIAASSVIRETNCIACVCVCACVRARVCVSVRMRVCMYVCIIGILYVSLTDSLPR